MKTRIGEVAGRVWHTLEKTGPVSVGALSKRIAGVPASTVLMALGWLAREDQVEFVTEGNKTRVAIRRQR